MTWIPWTFVNYENLSPGSGDGTTTSTVHACQSSSYYCLRCTYKTQTSHSISPHLRHRSYQRNTMWCALKSTYCTCWSTLVVKWRRTVRETLKRYCSSTDTLFEASTRFILHTRSYCSLILVACLLLTFSTALLQIQYQSCLRQGYFRLANLWQSSCAEGRWREWLSKEQVMKREREIWNDYYDNWGQVSTNLRFWATLLDIADSRDVNEYIVWITVGTYK